MDQDSRLSGRTASPPAVETAPRSKDKAQRRSLLRDPLKNLKGSYKKLTHLQGLFPQKSILPLNALKALKASSKPDSSLKDVVSVVPSPLVKSLASTWSTTASQPASNSTNTDQSSDNKLPPLSGSHLAPGHDSMPSSPECTSTQKRKQGTEHDDTPSRRTKAKPAKTRPSDPELERWVNDQQIFTSSTNASPTNGPPEDELGDIRIPPTVSRSSTLDFAQQPGQPQQTSTSPLHQFADHERRDSTATSYRSTNRESIFSTYTVRTGLTSPSELSISSASVRPHRTSSYFSKLSNPSPRSSIAPSPPPLAFIYRTPSGQTVGIFDEADVASGAVQGQRPTAPVPALPVIDPSKSQQLQTVLGLDLRNLSSAVNVDQMVKMGHMAQERRLHLRKPPDLTILPHVDIMILDVPKPMASPCAITESLTPIKEVASDDGRSTTSVPAHADEEETADEEIIRCRSPDPVGTVTISIKESEYLFEVADRCRAISNDSGYGGSSYGSSTGNQPSNVQPLLPPRPVPAHLLGDPSCTVGVGAWASMPPRSKSHTLDNIVSDVETLQSQVEANKQGYRLDNICSVEATTPTALPHGGSFRHNPQSPGSSDKESGTAVADAQTSPGPSMTPATSVADPSETPGTAHTDGSEEIDDSASEFTDCTDESLFEAVEAFNPALSNPLVLSIIQAFNEEVLGLVLARLGDLGASAHGVVQHPSGQSSGSSAPSGSSRNAPSQSRGNVAQDRAVRKRPLDNGDEESNNNDENEKRKKPRAATKTPSDGLQRYRRLACPFYKRYPDVQWKSKSCYGPGYDTAHRHKEHLYRYHNTPYCERCHATFENQGALNEHRRRPEGCEVVDGPLGHLGITPEQIEKLRSRKKSEGDGKLSEEAKWKKMFLLLFPEIPESEVPSPYYDLETCERLLTPATAHAFRQFLREDIPDRMMPQVAEALAELRLQPQPSDENLLNQLRGIITECLEVALNNLPARLLVEDQPSQSPQPGPEPEQEAEQEAEQESEPEVKPEPEHHRQQPSTTDAPTAHNTAQIGAQFPAHLPEHRPAPATITWQPVADVAMGPPGQTLRHTATSVNPAGVLEDDRAGPQEAEDIPLTFDNNNRPPQTLSPLQNRGDLNLNGPSNVFPDIFDGISFPNPLGPPAFGYDGTDTGGQPAPSSPEMLAAFNNWEQQSAMAPMHPFPTPGTAPVTSNDGNLNGYGAFNFGFEEANASYTNMPNAPFLFGVGDMSYSDGNNDGQSEFHVWYDANEHQQQQQY